MDPMDSNKTSKQKMFQEISSSPRDILMFCDFFHHLEFLGDQFLSSIMQLLRLLRLFCLQRACLRSDACNH